ncbi:O-methyltransferase [Paenibacillus sp. y28]|uniref:O-methyltransferase n=1 Tax=Paenibacillus sp. y28 TaxID=3129110 RepID=UPI003018AF96
MNEQNAEQYMEALYPEDDMLTLVQQGIARAGMPQISVSPGYGRLLTLLVQISGARQVLEIGALGGYSGICLARGLGEQGKLTSLELKAEFAEIARQHMIEAGFGDKVDYRIGEALDSLTQLEREAARFDLFFIDADKANYPAYLEWAIRLANPGALVIGDNTLMRGKTLHHEMQGQGVRGMRAFNQAIATDPRLESAMLPAYDGLAIARVKG